LESLSKELNFCLVGYDQDRVRGPGGGIGVTLGAEPNGRVRRIENVPAGHLGSHNKGFTEKSQKEIGKRWGGGVREDGGGGRLDLGAVERGKIGVKRNKKRNHTLGWCGGREDLLEKASCGSRTTEKKDRDDGPRGFRRRYGV